MRIFIDFEFTRLRQDAQPISVGMVAEDGQEFYAVFSNFRRVEVSKFVQKEVLPNLYCQNVNGPNIIKPTWTVAKEISHWLAQYDTVEFWGDAPAYDWVLFCELYNDPINKVTFPGNIKPGYLCRDLATLLELRGLDPDSDRNNLASVSANKHNAIGNARVIKLCYEKIMSQKK